MIEEALEHYDRILKTEPENAEAIGTKAMALGEKQGEFEQARLLLEPSLRNADMHIASAFAAVAPHFDRIPEAAGYLESIVEQDNISNCDLRLLHFSLAGYSTRPAITIVLFITSPRAMI